MNDPMLPLQGLRVFDLSQGIAGPYASMLLAAQGADVIKVEPPEGDWIRLQRQAVRGHVPAGLSVNVGKRSLALDLKHPPAREAARFVAAGCDVVLESFRPGVVARLGLDAATLRAERPELVYCSINGFGSRGPLSGRPVIDHVAQAYCGWMSLNADAQGVPQRTRNIVLADQVTGLFASQAIASALLGRFRSGQGATLEVTLAGAMAAFLAPRIVSHVLSEGRATQVEFTVPTGDYATADGLLVLAVRTPGDVATLCTLTGCAELLQDPRFDSPAARARHGEAMREVLAQRLLERSALEWEGLLAGQGLLACAVRDIGGFLDSQAADGLDLVDQGEMPGWGPVPLVRIPGAAPWTARPRSAHPPAVGEHGAEILREAGLSAAQIEAALSPGPH
ncbi:CaiB/BaiF CoA transferase family protein [Ramlibacter rhizophilus]|uniref:CoA transferase n=1 Tax=Ramlibacter rhizophilus TaxID=1781167 RepID=A0A4Z0BJ96_9BURK|nr:CoA transferase [Ramlibacter rhizophilus]TFY97968.1 CoA transferase [Ramlibacter rhizophilus]